MKILVTGYPGLLSMDLVPVLRAHHEVIPLSIQDLNITRKEEVFKIVRDCQPDILINCAGYTNVDLAETQWEESFRINALGPQYLALACREQNAALCQISTDYVFDGRSNKPYQPWDLPNPINVYGASKQAAEFFIDKLLERHFIVRTSSLYGKHGNNFVHTIIGMAEQGSPLKIVSDQVMSPTWTFNLSQGILRLIQSDNFGTYHLTDRTDGGISWYEFGKAILKARGLKKEIVPINCLDLNRPAPRPAYSVLDTRYLTMATDYRPFFWQEALEQYLTDSKPTNS